MGIRVSDTIHIGLSNLFAHKKRSFSVIFTTGILFSVLLALCMLLKGIENHVTSTETNVTMGKILLLAAVDQTICDDRCDIAKSLSDLETNVKKYGGEVLPTTIYSYNSEYFYQIDSRNFNPKYLSTSQDSEAYTLLASISAISNMLGIQPRDDASVRQKLNAIQTTRERSIGQIITWRSNPAFAATESPKFYVSDILPSNTSVSSLALSNIGQKANSLDLILGAIPVAGSLNFILQAPSQPSNDSMKKYDSSTLGQTILSFPDIKSAQLFSQDDMNSCKDTYIFSHTYPKSYQFKVKPAIGTPLDTATAFSSIWSIVHIILIVLGIIASIVAITTFVRLILGDVKNITLYYALGASKADVILLYVVYLLEICLAAIFLSLIMATIFVIVLNLINAEGFSQIFSLAYGSPEQPIFLIGFTPSAALLIFTFLLTPFLSIIFSYSAFSTHRLAKQIK